MLKLLWALAVGLAAIVPAVLETHDHWIVVRQFLHNLVSALH